MITTTAKISLAIQCHLVICKESSRKTGSVASGGEIRNTCSADSCLPLGATVLLVSENEGEEMQAVEGGKEGLWL